MLRRVLGTLGVVVLTALCVSIAHAQGGDPLEGDWWVRYRGNPHRGAGWLRFTPGTPSGTFDVTGYGSTMGLAAMFEVSASQSVTKDSDGLITGAIAIEDEATGVALGTMEFEKGVVRKQGESLKMKGTLNGDKLKLKGVRFPQNFSVLTGSDDDGRIKGKGVKGKPYDLTVDFDSFLPPALNTCGSISCPAFLYTGTGTVEIDDVEVADVPVSGRLVLDPREKAFGTFVSADLGDGAVRGRMKMKETAPRANLKAETDARDGKIKLKGDLTTAVSPILSVEPMDAFDFGSAKVGESVPRTFTLRNVGVGTLDGEIDLADAMAGFELDMIGAVSCPMLPPCLYSVDAGMSIDLIVLFAPEAEGDASTQLEFTGGGGATRDLSGTGTSLDVQPASQDFGNVNVGQFVDRDFTVENDGMSPITGSAMVSEGTPAFELVDDMGMVQSEIVYSLGPAEMATVTVRFMPTAAGDASGEVTFSGGGGATASLSGTGIGGGP